MRDRSGQLHPRGIALSAGATHHDEGQIDGSCVHRDRHFGALVVHRINHIVKCPCWQQGFDVVSVNEFFDAGDAAAWG